MVVLDQLALDAGTVRMEITLPPALALQGVESVTGVFPAEYPYFAPKVFAAGLQMDHHVNPFSGEICLLASPTRDWGTRDTLASLIASQLGAALSAAASSDRLDDVVALEAPQAEPFSAYYTSYTPGVTALVDGSWSIDPNVRMGSLDVRSNGLAPTQPLARPVLMGIVSVRDERGSECAALPEPLQRVLNGPDLAGRWVRLPAPPRSNDPAELWRIAESADVAGTSSHALEGRQVEFRAILFPQEVAQRESGDGWLLLQKLQGPPTPGASRSGSPARRQPQPVAPEYRLIRSGPAGRADLAARVPSYLPLSSKRVLLVGAGAIGSALALHLARAGLGALVIVDADILEPGNIVRHAASLHSVGWPKAIATGVLAHDVAPFSEVTCFTQSVGAIRDPEAAAAASPLDDLAGFHLVIDASADLGVQRFLAARAREAGIAYQFLEASNGGWGAMTALLTPRSTWCYSCYEWHKSDNLDLLPAAAPSPFVQPIGCAQPTFTGAAFDLEEVSLHAARVATDFLTIEEPSGLVDSLAVLALRDADGRRVVPTWRSHTMDAHPNCKASH